MRKAVRVMHVVVLVSDAPGGALDQRARALFGRLPDSFAVTIACHLGNATTRVSHFLRVLRATKPELIYIVDPIYAAVTATWLYRFRHSARVVLDTGDLVYELAREGGKHNAASLAIVKQAEQTALRMASCIIVRSPFHREWLRERGFARLTVIPDGVDLKQFFPTKDHRWRAQRRLHDGEIIVGGVGSMIWNRRRNTCFGWDLIEALALLRDVPVKGLLIGDGDGRPQLEARAMQLGISHNVIYTGRVPYADLNDAINALDIALLTQTNDPIAWVRTTGKLPLYLACDRYIVASDVGEAARVLEPYDMLLPYAGTGRDEQYPARLAQKVRTLTQQPERLQLHGLGVQLARENFDYTRLAQILADVVSES